MKKIIPTLFVLIISLRNKFSVRGGAKPRFCEADTLRGKEARERKTSRRNNNAEIVSFRPQPAKGFLICIITLFVLTSISINQARAAWIDDYFNSAVSTAPSAAKSQQRGYYTAGGFTARVPHKKEPLMTASLPTISVGCGGIDMFWGGVSFMNFDYLVQKAKGILQNAPYVLFSIGLKALSTQFGDTIEAVQAIVDQLNQIQFDECSAAKGLVGLAMGDGDAVSGIMGEWDRLKTNATKLKEGWGKTWDKVAKQTNDNPKEEKNKVVDVKIKDPKAREFLTGKGYVLDKLASTGWDYVTADEALMIRALIGDVYYDNSQKEAKYIFKPGCASNLDFVGYVYNPTPIQTVPSLEAGGACGSVGISINDRTVNILDALYNGYTNDTTRKSPFTADILNFLDRAEIPVMAYFSTAAIAGEDYLAAVKTTMGGAVAAGYAYGSLKNLSSVISKTIFALRNHMNGQDYFVEGFVGALNEFNGAIRERIRAFEVEYSLVLQRLNTTFELTRKSEVAAREIETIKKNSYLFNSQTR